MNHPKSWYHHRKLIHRHCLSRYLHDYLHFGHWMNLHLQEHQRHHYCSAAHFRQIARREYQQEDPTTDLASPQ